MSLFVGITSWNSRTFLDVCLHSLRATGGDVDVCVLDNDSTDDSCEVARRYGAKVIRQACSQPCAMNILAAQSRHPFTLLVHADVVFLGKDWKALCIEAVRRGASLVSPEDIGCGNGTRPWGRGMPESSFLFFETRMLKKLREIRWTRKWRIPWPERRVDFFGDHITYNLPDTLARRGGIIRFLDVHTSPAVQEPIANPIQTYPHWQSDWVNLRYGLGNFYTLEGSLTHYHNWYDRLNATDGSSSQDLPMEFLSAYSRNFLEDYKNRALQFPENLRMPSVS